MNKRQYTNLLPEHAARLTELMATCFPQIGDKDLLDEADFQRIATHFPAGTFVALDGERTVGLGTGLFLDIDFANLPPTEHELIGGHQYANHSDCGLLIMGIVYTLVQV